MQNKIQSLPCGLQASVIRPLASSQNSFTSAVTLASSFQPQCLLLATFPPDLPCRPLNIILGILCFLEQTRQSPKLRPLCGSSCAKISLPPDIWMLHSTSPETHLASYLILPVSPQSPALWIFSVTFYFPL